MVLLKLFVLFVHRKEFIDLLVYTHENFWHTNYTNNELLLLQNCKRISMLCITLINVCAQGTIVSYVLTPIVGESLFFFLFLKFILKYSRIFIRCRSIEWIFVMENLVEKEKKKKGEVIIEYVRYFRITKRTEKKDEVINT